LILRGLQRLTALASQTPVDVRQSDRVRPIASELAGLTSWAGIRRGATAAISPGGMSLAIALLVADSASGQWCPGPGFWWPVTSSVSISVD
jgi:hypothetical protein